MRRFKLSSKIIDDDYNKTFNILKYKILKEINTCYPKYYETIEVVDIEYRLDEASSMYIVLVSFATCTMFNESKYYYDDNIVVSKLCP